MLDLHQTLYKFHELSIVTGVHKSHLGENLTDYRLKDYLFISKYLKSELNIIFSNILPQTGNNDTGR